MRYALRANLTDWVISPGSRNAPITLSIANDSRFNCEVVVDERSAAFIAMGKSLRSGVPSIITCTSGSAALNYAPAISEAYYQEIPLLIVTADRPQKWIDNGEGQSINQVDVYRNYCLASFHINDTDSKEHLFKIFNDIHQVLFGDRKGPVHLNMAFDEPLYDTSPTEMLEEVDLDFSVSEKTLKISEYIDEWKNFEKILILVGQHQKDEKLNDLLSQLLKDKRVSVLTETNANVYDFHFIKCIDRTLPDIHETKYHPELVITIGGAIVSKRVKKYLRCVENLEHWHVSDSGVFPDVFERIGKKLSISGVDFLRSVLDNIEFESTSQYQNIWIERSFRNQSKHETFLREVQWSDFKAHAIIHDWLPENSVLHQGNSSVVRYYQLFDNIPSVEYQSNRGVSGIDGIMSTAVGYSSKDNRLNVVVIGDLSFGYDINAFWNRVKSDNLLIIVIDNGGGGIFRIIDGPSSTGVLEECFEVGNVPRIADLAASFGVDYYGAESEDEFIDVLQKVDNAIHSGGFKKSIISVKTQNIISEKTLKEYFLFVNKA